MSASPQLTRALQKALGEDPSVELLAMFASNQSDHTEIRSDIAEIRSDIAEIRSDISSLKGDVAELRHEMLVGFEKLRADVAERVESRYGDLMKWSFVYWVGAVTAIAVLFRTLR